MSSFDFRGLSDRELDNRFNTLKVEISATRAHLDERVSPRKRTFRIIRSTLLNFAGLALAAPTSGASTILCAVGISEWVEMIEDDARDYNRRIRLSALLRHQNDRLNAFEAEYERRNRLK